MPLPQQPRAVFFDIGGPIYSDDNFVVAVLAALDELRADNGDPAADRERFRSIYDGVRDRQAGSLRRALAEEFLGSADARETLHERTRDHWTHPPGTAYEDAKPAMRALSGRVTVGVLANQEATVVDALERDGLAPYIDVWGVSALVGHEKPAPALFRWALDTAGTDAAHAVHVGNRLDTDVRPAKAMGLGTVWVTRGEAPDRPTTEQLAEADLAVPDLSGIADALLGRRSPPDAHPSPTTTARGEASC